MIGIILGLLILWVVFSVLGFAIKGLLWLAFIGIILFVITGIIGVIRRGTSRKS
jgi:hypothetical protein